jgi:putative acetyltransferase
MRTIRRAVDVEIRGEEPRDVDVVRAVNELAFGRPDEARLVDALRGSLHSVSLIAAIGDRIVGHILFTPVLVERMDPADAAAGLAPMAVHPDYQRRGIGSALVRAGLAACATAGCAVVVVLGHPEFYMRFGFVAAHTKSLQYPHPVPREAFMVTELRPGALQHVGGVVRYDAAFGRV